MLADKVIGLRSTFGRVLCARCLLTSVASVNAIRKAKVQVYKDTKYKRNIRSLAFSFYFFFEESDEGPAVGIQL